MCPLHEHIKKQGAVDVPLLPGTVHMYRAPTGTRPSDFVVIGVDETGELVSMLGCFGSELLSSFSAPDGVGKSRDVGRRQR